MYETYVHGDIIYNELIENYYKNMRSLDDRHDLGCCGESGINEFGNDMGRIYELFKLLILIYLKIYLIQIS